MLRAHRDGLFEEKEEELKVQTVNCHVFFYDYPTLSCLRLMNKEQKSQKALSDSRLP